MRNHRILRFAAGCLIALLCACGGGDDDGNTPIVVTDISGLLVVGEPYLVAGVITPGDSRAPDGSHLDFYLVTAAASDNLFVEMRSAEVDSYLYLFSDACLGLPLSAWEPCKLWEDDDSGTGPNDAYFEAGPMAGQGYVIAANTYWPSQFGSYTLEVLLQAPPTPP